MKIPFLLAAIGVLMVAFIMYPLKLQERAEKRVVAAVWNELEGRTKIEESVKQELESKRRNKAFVDQLEYRKEIENAVDAGLAQIRGNLSALKSELEAGVNRHGDALDQKNAALAERVAIQEGIVRGYAKQLDGYRREREAAEQQLHERILELEMLVSRRFRNADNDRLESRGQMELLSKDLEKTRRRIDSLEKRLVGVENQSQHVKKAN